MNIGTSVTYKDPNDNVYAGIVCGRDFTIGPVWRDVAGKVRRTLEGGLATTRSSPQDTVANEPIDTGLVNVFAIGRDGTQTFLVLHPDDLTDPESFASPPEPPRPIDRTP